MQMIRIERRFVATLGRAVCGSLNAARLRSAASRVACVLSAALPHVCSTCDLQAVTPDCADGPFATDRASGASGLRTVKEYVKVTLIVDNVGAG